MRCLLVYYNKYSLVISTKRKERMNQTCCAQIKKKNATVKATFLLAQVS